MTDTNASTDSTGDQAKQAASDVAGHASGKASGVADSAKSEARSVANDARDQASDVLATTRSELRDRATEQTKTLSSKLDDIGRQLGDMADGSSDPQAQVAQLARSAADSLSTRAQKLDDDGFDGLVDDMKRFARNRPGAFLLGAVAAGFAVGRLAKHADLKQSMEQAKGELDPQALKPGSSNSTSGSPVRSTSAAPSATPTPTPTPPPPPAPATAPSGPTAGRP